MIDFSKNLKMLMEDIKYQKHLVDHFDSTENPEIFYDNNLYPSAFLNTIALILNPIIKHGISQGYKAFAFPPQYIVNTTIHELLSNSVKRGNKEDFSKKVIVNVLGGELGAIITSTDQGDGYDYRTEQKSFEKIPQSSLNIPGRGTGYYYFNQEHLLFTVADKGRTGIIKLDYKLHK